MVEEREINNLVENIIKGNHRAIAKAITLMEDRAPEHRHLLSRLYGHMQQQTTHKVNNNSQIIGVTGSPGAGKSTIVNGLVQKWRSKGKKVAIIAVDPTSPFSGGALLGDRVRMRDHEEDDHVFIRSMGTRGSLGGLSDACQDVVRVIQAAGFHYIVVETVGVGQAELDIMKTADTIALVLYPSGGDIIQAFKAGIMEIADLFIINKADLPGVPQLKGELEDLLHITDREEKWKPPILQTISTEKHGLVEVAEAIEKHGNYLIDSGLISERRISQKEQEILRRLKERFSHEIAPILKETLQMAADSEKIMEQDPYDTAEKIYEKWRQEMNKKKGGG
ncbi:methylmalonyl Co-A mutase-associated GTPase MeaB [Evansella sp. AB-P1]|uniref:methylmalonyl Co-A mutase-associated GTPase MeaB n=1 Tax=Evansella sp. AB-P1 TaxID=3037653 RepID=UPI00241FF072|nr:methylmalonyl Co-A mutase-associated GTPase MeaB [Evansella sp. AB-P1]MDG5787355.1 methylmalonyl Co-A mutase-associated GTPase MeaB [Evansella sp. AB-P1]